MRFTYSKLCSILLPICLFIMAGGYYILPGDYIGEYNIRFFIAVVGILLGLYARFMTISRDKILLRKIDYIVVLILLVSVGEMILSKSRYGYGLRDTVVGFLPYLYVMYAYPLLYVCIKEKTIFPIVEKLAIVELVMLVIRFITFYLYNYQDISIFPRLLFQYHEWQRDGIQRIEASVFFGIALAFWTVKALKGKKTRKILYWCVVAFMLAFLAFASMVRFQSTVALLVIFIVIYFIRQRKTSKGVLTRASLIMLVILAGFVGGGFEILADLVSVNGAYGAQTSVRLYGMTHYLGMLKGSRLFWGLGFLNADYPHVEKMMLRDQWSIYYLDDLGYVGGIAQFGLLAAFMYVPLFWLAICAVIRCQKTKNELYFGISLGITIYMIVSCLLLNIFDSQRAFDVPFYIGILAYINMLPALGDHVVNITGRKRIFFNLRE